MDKDNIIDLGSINVPTSWNEISLKQFQEIEKYYSDKDKEFDARDVINIFINKDRDYINTLPLEFTEKIMEKLLFLQEQPEFDKADNKIKIDGKEYIINFMNKLKTGEYVAVDAVIKSDPHNYAAILAILCRQDGEIYDTKFENEILEERVKMFENQPVIKIMPLVFFFINLYAVLKIPSQLSSEVEGGINHIANDIETSRKNGDLSVLSTWRLKRKLRKLKKSIKSI